MSLFPIFLKLEGRQVLVVGGGAIAAPKVEQLLAAGAVVNVIAPEASAAICELAAQGSIPWQQRPFERRDVTGKTLVFAATGQAEVNREVFEACTAAGVLCNVIDVPEQCDFYSSAVVKRGDLQIAISTNGQSPALAQQIRKQLELQFGDCWADYVRLLGRERKHILHTVEPGPTRSALLHDQARAVLARYSRVVSCAAEVASS